MLRPRNIRNMGKTEKEAKMRRRKGEIQNALLGALEISGLLLVSMAAPNTLQLLGKFGGNKYRFANQAKNALTRLARKGQVKFVEKDGKRYAQITETGRANLQMHTMKMSVARPKRWDKRWRLVLFDIPEKRRSTRDALRKHMRHIGFYRLQDSAWIYPYECEEIIALLKTNFHLGNAVIYMVVESLENDRRLRDEFGLK